MTTIADIIATAARSVGAAHRDHSGIGYYAYVPYHDDQPRGPSTEIRASSREAMLLRLRGHKTAIALALAADALEISGDDWDADCEWLIDRISTGYETGDWRSAVRALVRKYRTTH